MGSHKEVKFIHDKGIIFFEKGRVVFYDADNYWLLRNDLISSFGIRKTQQIFLKLGYSSGYCFAERVTKKEKSKASKESSFVKKMLERISGYGFGTVKIKEIGDSRKSDFLNIEVEVKDSFEAELHLSRSKNNEQTGCWFLRGYISGFMSKIFNEDIYFYEVSCRGKGDSACCLIGKPYDESFDDINADSIFKSKDSFQNALQEILNDLRKSEEKYHNLYDGSLVSYFSLDSKGRVIECNRTTCNMLGYSMDEIIGQDVTNLFLDFDKKFFWHLSQSKQGFKNRDAVAVRKDQFRLYVLMDAIVDFKKENEIESVRCTLIDISEFKRLEHQLKKKNEMLETMNKIDPLTTLYNRRYLMETFVTEFEKANRYGYPLSLLMLDLDRFKQINDYFGHQIGDMVLKKVADLLRENIRRGDILARFGGEEFIVIAPFTDIEGAYDLADKIRMVIEKESSMEIEKDVIINVTSSFGVSTYFNNNYLDLDGFIRAADDALYKSKRSGRNRVVALNI